jgi:hypothetical protein
MSSFVNIIIEQMFAVKRELLNFSLFFEKNLFLRCNRLGYSINLPGESKRAAFLRRTATLHRMRVKVNKPIFPPVKQNIYIRIAIASINQAILIPIQCGI